jgi:hypothetical protein
MLSKYTYYILHGVVPWIHLLPVSRALRLLPTKTKRGCVSPPPALNLLDPQSKQPL